MKDAGRAFKPVVFLPARSPLCTTEISAVGEAVLPDDPSGWEEEMIRNLLIAAALCGVACSGSNTEPTMESTSGEESTALAMPAPGRVALLEAPESSLPEFSRSELADLPTAPWASTALVADEVPAVVVAWAMAENRNWCAPMAPPAIEGVAARASELDGGWIVEFDQPGQPGVDAEGEACADCGRGVFGIAGTSMGVDEMIESPRPSYADGSATEMSPEDGSVVSATIAVPGQGCVYQVWSFLGADHLEQMMSSLRFVDTSNSATQVADLAVY